MESASSQRTRAAFLREGLEMLADTGPRSLTAAGVSKQLNVTTGSFYWHFRTVAEFHNRVKKFWLNEILIPLIAEARAQAEDPGSILEIIGQIARRRGIVRYDRAMRNWSRSDEEAKRIVVAADKLRQELIKEVFQTKGESNKAASEKAELFRAAWLGSQSIEDSDHRFNLLGMITGDKNSRSRAP